MKEQNLTVLRHSVSHILAQAVKRLYPEVKLAIGPAIENGFYYDFDTETKLIPEDFGKIEKEMQNIIKEDLAIERFELPRKEAIDLMQEKDEPYKVELIKDLPENTVISFYKQGEFVDLCAGPHLLKTGEVKAFKLLSLAGAYWRGNEKNKMLQRIYGTAFFTKEDLDAYLNQVEEAKKRDHRKIGNELELFAFMQEGQGFPFFLPNGMIIKNELTKFWREVHIKNNYKEIATPIILNEELWHQSGHWEHYKENMYTTKIDEVDFGIKPMNCPGSILVYKNRPRSYKELPLRLAEMGIVHRHEKSGNLHGLMRVRCFTQDDAHIFMATSQTTQEVTKVIKLIDSFYKHFGFSYHVELSTRPENSMGTDEQWEQATNSLKEALEQNNIAYEINEGDGAFYGPKIDFHLTDCIGRTWQCGTIQLDFQMPERFGLSYIDKNGEKQIPVMIHRVILGSIERFIGILTEHLAGAFYCWLAPEQVRVLPIAEKHQEFANKVVAELQEQEIRVQIDCSRETFGKRLRQAITQKIPYILIVGEKEVESGAVTVKNRETGNQEVLSVQEFLSRIKKEIASRSNRLNVV